jgi:hypothetical protein
MDAGGWDERYSAVERLWPVSPNLFLEDRLGTLEPGVGLDLAAGEGRNTLWLRDRGWEMTAIDFSSVALERGSDTDDRVDWVVADVMSWEPERSYDLVVIAYLHLLEDHLRYVVERASRWLEPRGELFMIGHDLANLEKGYGGPQVPEVLWVVNRIRGWLEGLTIVEAQVVRRPVETDEGVFFARDALVRAHNL